MLEQTKKSEVWLLPIWMTILSGAGGFGLSRVLGRVNTCNVYGRVKLWKSLHHCWI